MYQVESESLPKITPYLINQRHPLLLLRVILQLMVFITFKVQIDTLQHMINHILTTDR